LDWTQSSLWQYWIEGCLSTSSTRFRKFFRITRSRFDEIYLAAADSGEFRLNPAEPLFARAFPEKPPGKHGAQLPKVIPLCLRIGACLRRLATGEPWSSLDYCKVTDTVAMTEVDTGFEDKRDLLTEHLRLVSGAGHCGEKQFRWLKAATDCRPGFA
jgi:hypothetical protein